MKLDFSKIRSCETPVLRLRTLSGRNIGVLNHVMNLHFSVNYAELSEIEFEIPYMSDGVKNPLYDQVTGRKQIYTEDCGVYILMNPQIEGDGAKEVKKCVGYSLEYGFTDKILFLEEGTYNLWDPINPSDTILGRIIELDPTWSVGDIDYSLLSGSRRYRTFDEYNGRALDFCYNDAPEKFQCLFVFDPYERKINLVDATAEVSTIPVYLDYQNLIESVKVKELSEEVITKLFPYGADGLSIREVNPTGKAYIVDLSHYMNNGDISAEVSERIQGWQLAIQNRKLEYTGVVNMRASATALLVSAKAYLTDLQGELSSLIGQQSVTIQAIAMESTDKGKATQQAELDRINAEIAAKNAEISAEQARIAQIEANITSYTTRIQAFTELLAMESYFTSDEMDEIRPYLIEEEVEENTFIASTIDTSVSGESFTVSGTVSITSQTISELFPDDGVTMYLFDGGTITMPRLSAEIIRGTFEFSGNELVMSAYVASGAKDGVSFPSGLVTISGIPGEMMVGYGSGGSTITSVSFKPDNARVYFTANVSDYQRYSVAESLYTYGVEILAERNWPGFEYSIEAANPLFIEEFAPFAERLELGRGVYVNVHQLSDTDDQGASTYSLARGVAPTAETVRIATLIGVEIGFDSPDDFSFTFSSRFRRHDETATLMDTIQSSYSSGRSFDASKYIYNQTANKTSQVTEFMNSSLDASKNTIIGATDQSVIMDGNGLQIGGKEDYQIRVVDRMIAMTDDNWATAKLAIGYFALPGGGNYWGINADLLAGKLLIGNSMVIENPTDDGTMQFKVDSSGAWLYNSVFSLSHDGGGKILIHPEYGIAGGMSGLYTTDGTTITPSFIDDRGDIVFDKDGFPANTSLFLDIRDGSAYFRGKIYATDGVFSGELQAATGTFSGELSAATGTFEGEITGGSINIGDSFKVDSNGNLTASSGTFSGVISGADYLDDIGESMMESGRFKSKYLNIKGMTITNSAGNTSFAVNSNGDVTINGNVTMTGGSISWNNIDDTQSSAYKLAGEAKSIANLAGSSAAAAASAASDASELAKQIARGEYIEGEENKPTFISQNMIYSPVIYGPTIYANTFSVMPQTHSTTGGFKIYGYWDSYDDIREMLHIYYYGEGLSPNLIFDSYYAGYTYWKLPETNFEKNVRFNGEVDFSEARVIGLPATTVSAANVTDLDDYIANYLASNPPVAVFGA